MRVEAKICGIKTTETLNAAVTGGAAFIGLVFHPPSPRYLSLEAAASLRRAVPPGVKAVALVVDADDATLQRIARDVRPDVFQLQGAETVKRSADIKSLTGALIIRAMSIARAEDIAAALPYQAVADWLMFDAKPAPGATSPGGSGESFDWKLLSGRRFQKPWLLAGGLNEGNVAAAIEASGAALVDVSSGVERTRGEKDPALIRAFLDRVRAL